MVAAPDRLIPKFSCAAACRRLLVCCPELARSAPALAAVSAQDDLSINAAVELLQPLLWDSSYTLAVGGCFLPVLPLVLHKALQHNKTAPADFTSHERICLALALLLELYPPVYREVLQFFDAAPPPFERLVSGPLAGIANLSLEENVDTLTSILQTSLHLLRQPGQHWSERWNWGPILQLVVHASADVRWHALQCMACVLRLSDATLRTLSDQLLSAEEQMCCMVRWDAHSAGIARARGLAAASGQSQEVLDSMYITSHDSHVDVCGFFLPRRQESSSTTPVYQSRRLVLTSTTRQNLESACMALSQSRPVLLEGPPGSGKTALVQELALLTGNIDMVRLQVDDQTDSKGLLGAYACTEIPGEFIWQPGALMQAVQRGLWVLIEDIDAAPFEVLASLRSLLEDRLLHIPSRGQVIKAAHGFQVFATITQSDRMSPLHDLFTAVWSRVQVEMPHDEELSTILTTSFPSLSRVIPGMLDTLNTLRMTTGHSNSPELSTATALAALHFSVRDAFKWCQRVASSGLELSSKHLPTHAREYIFREGYDCFVAGIPNKQHRAVLAEAIARQWGITFERADYFQSLHKPHYQATQTTVTVGRALLSVPEDRRKTVQDRAQRITFAQTATAMQMLEQLAVCVKHSEPALLVGETGTGKTAVVQNLARALGFPLTVLNLSQQSDSTDLIGGFKPADMHHVCMPLVQTFTTLFDRSFSRQHNEEYIRRVHRLLEKRRWQPLLKALRGVLARVDQLRSENIASDHPTKPNGNGTVRPSKRHRLAASLSEWQAFAIGLSRAERQVEAAQNAFTFAFVEGALVKAVRQGEWLLLDEVNLAPAETLERLSGLLDTGGSVCLTERGDVEAVVRHPNFRVFACMNPATDVGKRQLPAALKNKFTEVFVDEMVNREDLREFVHYYLRDSIPQPPVDDIIDFYLAARAMADDRLVDGANQKPQYSLRTLARALEYTRSAMTVYGFQRALYDGFCMCFLTLLQNDCMPALEKLLDKQLLKGVPIKTVQRIPPSPGDNYVKVESFWLERGPQPLSPPNEAGGSPYVLTKSVRMHLHNIARAVLMRRYPVLLQGPTSSGKTSMVEFLAEQTGHKFVRINNHEQTDLQEYLGTYVSDSSGKLVFQEGALVDAVRNGHWIVLDELNLAPSDVLEALNRLLDDNRELFLPELQVTVKPHPHFMLFATQNPPGLYGGRKVLSRAFRNRFMELHIDDIPHDELSTILQQRCLIPPSYANKLVEIMRDLQRQRQSSDVFAGKHGFITLRDLFRWALRRANGYEGLARDGYMILAERLRHPEERSIVQQTLQKHLRVQFDPSSFYEGAEAVMRLQSILSSTADSSIGRVVWTRAMQRLLVLVEACARHDEPVLLVGETGTGKTSVCQLMALLLGRNLRILNCHQHTETSDFIGGYRPVRDRQHIIVSYSRALASALKLPAFATAAEVSTDITDAYQVLGALEAALGSWMKGSGKRNNDKKASAEQTQAAQAALSELRDLQIRYNGLFVWEDGPLVKAMKQGELLLVDEISLAEDAVLERLNPVLEPKRLLVLAEQGGKTIQAVQAQPGFLLLATMNPGGDFGKRELSPALRNRFTEIWVPAISDVSDLRAILDDRLQSAALRTLSDPLLDFWQWLHARQGSRRVMSIRDLLAWAAFIVTAHSRVGLHASYVHGAFLVILDGLGAGLGMPDEAVRQLRAEGLQFLLQQLPVESRLAVQVSCTTPGQQPHANGTTASALTAETDSMQVEEGSPEQFGLMPFYISKGHHSIAGAPFQLDAPTTAANAMRLLRAMQLPKPVLLEGDPGVGKTSLVSAIAAASGHRLVRINLSEQTDMMDLLGSDLPVDGGKGGEFWWSDGVFLQALKAGDWVLLDELNLASQSVLEGLNSVLDHRAEVFIPELGQTYACPKTFRIFACQNPIQQGGGRKGLPKSFLNRFTRVHVELLQAADLRFICSALYPKLREDTREKMIEFNSRLHHATMVARKFGQQGGPWEFNLRDVLRWCHLCSDGSQADPGAYLDMLYVQRMRTEEDRQHIRDLYSTVFGASAQNDTHPPVFISPDSLQVGSVQLTRHPQPQPETRTQMQFLRSTAWHVKSLMRCVQQGWMCNLVGPTSAGKTSLVRMLAQITGSTLHEYSLTNATDTSDLLGCFEQYDPNRKLGELSGRAHELLQQVASQLLVVPVHSSPEGNADHSLMLQSLQHVSSLLGTWHAYHNRAGVPGLSSAGAELDTTAVQLLGQLADQLHEACNAVLSSAELQHSASRLLRDVQALKASASSSAGGRFEWVSGALLKAIQDGEWVLLDNANLCHPTVLDRLNSLLEPDGTLLVNERGLVDGKPLVVQTHPQFRLFLTVDPKYGEVSRAMRNRGIELFLPALADSKSSASVAAAHDAADVLAAHGVAEDMQQTMWTLHKQIAFLSQGPISMRKLQLWARTLQELRQWGVPVQQALAASLHRLYPIKDAARPLLLEHLQVSEPDATASPVAAPGISRLSTDSASASVLRDAVPLLRIISAVQRATATGQPASVIGLSDVTLQHVWFAAAWFIGRATPLDHALRLFWALAYADAVSKEQTDRLHAAIEQFVWVLQREVEHPIWTALLELHMPQELSRMLPMSDHSVLLMTLADGLPLSEELLKLYRKRLLLRRHLALEYQQTASVADQVTNLHASYESHTRPAERSRQRTQHPLVPLVYPFLTMLGTVLSDLLKPSAAWTLAIEDAIEVVQLWQSGLQHQLLQQTVQPVALVACWQLLKGALVRLHAVSAHGSDSWQRLLQIARLVNEACGLSQTPCKFLLWKGGGHPQLQRTLELCEQEMMITTLCQSISCYQFDAKAVEENALALVVTDDFKQAVLEVACFYHGQHPHAGMQPDQQAQMTELSALLQNRLNDFRALIECSDAGMEHIPAANWSEMLNANGFCLAFAPKVLVSPRVRALQAQLSPMLHVQSLHKDIMVWAALTRAACSLDELKLTQDMLNATSAAVQWSTANTTRSPLDFAAHQQLLWIVNAGQDAEKLLPQLVQDYWYRWHVTASAIPTWTAVRTSVALKLAAAQSELRDLPARRAQLQLAVRGLLTDTQADVRSLVAACGSLLIQMVLAHRSAMPDSSAPELVHLFQRLLQMLHGIGSHDRSESDALYSSVARILRSASHARFLLVLEPLLLPAFRTLCEAVPSSSAALAMIGSLWAYIGAARLHLLQPEDNCDPVAKQTQKLAQLTSAISDVRIELATTRYIVGYELGADTDSSIERLVSRESALLAEAERARAKAFIRPDPSQFGDLRQDILGFTSALASIAKAASLIASLQHNVTSESIQQASIWQHSIDSLLLRLQRYPLYRDITQPIEHALLELKHGLMMLNGAQTLPAETVQQSVMASMTFPRAYIQRSRDDVSSLMAPTVTDAETARLALLALRTDLIDACKQLYRGGALDSSALQPVAALLERLVTAWRVAAEQQRAKEEEEAALYKTKDSAPLTEEEMDEASYQELFPDYHATFADVRDAEDFTPDGVLQPPVAVARASPKLGTLQIEQEILEDVVAAHYRTFTGLVSSNTDATDREAILQVAQSSFLQRYDLGRHVLEYHAQPLPFMADSRAVSGHALRLATEWQKLTEAGEASLVSLNKKPCIREAALLVEPVIALVHRVRELLQEWQDNPLLLQLLAICERLLSMPLTAPLMQFLVGAELLLSRAQTWEQNAARHVSIASQLETVAKLIARWRQLELASWPAVLEEVAGKHRLSARRLWFRLYDLVHRPFAEDWEADLRESTAALEQFVQTSSSGEYEMRLQLLQGFYAELTAFVSANIAPGQISIDGARRLSFVLYNLHSYYRQFVPHIEAAIATDKASVEQELKDFVKLSKWEDHNYYAMAASADKAHRKLHKLSQKYDAVLRKPVMQVFKAEASGLGVQQATNTVAKEPEASRDTDATEKPSVLPLLVHFPTVVNVDNVDAVLHRPKDSTAIARMRDALRLDDTTLYQNRLSNLWSRMQQLVGGISRVGSVEGAHTVDDLGAVILRRVTELRSGNAKTAVKKKAFTDYVRVLQEQGVSTNLSAVPAAERDSNAWFHEPPMHGVGEHLARFHKAGAMEAGEPSTLWGKADSYYLRNVALAQQLAQSANEFNKDLSLREVELSVRGSAHLLHIQRKQRRLLLATTTSHVQLERVADVVNMLDSKLPPQRQTREWLLWQRCSLDALVLTFIDGLAYFRNIADVETSSRLGPTITACRCLVAEALGQLQESKGALDNAVGMLPVGSVAQFVLLTSSVHTTLQQNQAVLRELHERFASAATDWQPPGWSIMVDALRNAVEDETNSSISVEVTAVEADTHDETVSTKFSELYEGVVKELLLAVQKLHAVSSSENDDDADVMPSMMHAADRMEAQLTSLRTEQLTFAMLQLMTALGSTVDACNVHSHGQHLVAGQVALLQRLSAPLRLIADTTRVLLADYVAMHKAVAKLGYIVSSVLVTLLREGFCTPKEEADGKDGNGKFEQEAEGTGMGEGEGRKDVSDEIENEDQLLGDQQKGPDAEKGAEGPDDKGVEMQQDFEGAMHDISEDEDYEQNEEDDAEPLPQEMGDLQNQGDVVDEKLWGDDDAKDQEAEKQPESYEKDAPIQASAQQELDYRGTDDAQGDDADKEPLDQEQQQQQHPEKAAGEDMESEEHEPSEQVEDSHGLQAKADEQLELDDNMDLDQEDAEDATDEGGEDADADAEANDSETNPAAAPEASAAAEHAAEDAPAEEAEAEPDVDATEQQADDAQDMDTQQTPEEEERDDMAGDQQAQHADVEPDTARPAADEDVDAARLTQRQPQAIAASTFGPSGHEAQMQAEEDMDAQAEQQAGMQPPDNQTQTQAAAEGVEGQFASGQASQPQAKQTQPLDANPYRSLGDALKRWRERLTVVHDSAAEPSAEPTSAQVESDIVDKEDTSATYEYAPENAGTDAQTLGTATDEQLAAAETQDGIEAEDEDMAEAFPPGHDEEDDQINQRAPDVAPGTVQSRKVEQSNIAGDLAEAVQESIQVPDGDGADAQRSWGDGIETQITSSVTVQELKPLALSNNLADRTPLTKEELARMRQEVAAQLQAWQEGDHARLQARELWQRYELLTHQLSQELTEQLRLILEPTSASKLQGDYRSGKRISMKKVIAYIASQFRKDKIWLRRTKPDKRQYQVVLAIDDSRSMTETGCGSLALESMTLLAKALTHLEVGELSIISFGGRERVRVLHSFDQPFSDEAGIDVISQFSFQQDNTIADAPVKDLLEHLTRMLDHARSRQSASLSAQPLQQLVLIVADGRFHEKESLQRCVREAMTREQLLAFIVLDNPSDSILDMQTVSFAGGTPAFNNYLDTFPFPYYILLRDIGALPRTLADLLRQWFELTQRSLT
eukprot:jgi/Chlat1/7586/Chrsp63S07074